MLTHKDAEKARKDFGDMQIFSDDDNKASGFYANIIEEFQIVPQHNPRIAFIVVAHFVHTLPNFLNALSTLGDVTALIPKKSEVVPAVREALLQIYGSIIVTDVDKKILRDDAVATEAFLKKILLSENLKGHQFIIIDHGGYFAPRIHDIIPKFQNRILGIVEHTWNGEIRYQSELSSDKTLCVPVVSIAHSKLKSQESDAVARSIVKAIFSKICTAEGMNKDETLLKHILILGYGNIGKLVADGIRKALPNKGREVIHICDTYANAREAASKFFPNQNITGTKQDFLSQADLIVTATSTVALTKEDFSCLKPGACIVCATSSDDQFSEDALTDYEIFLPKTKPTAQSLVQGLVSVDVENKNTMQKRDQKILVKYQHKQDCNRFIYLAADGGSVNFLIGSTPHPILHAVFSSICISAQRLCNIDIRSTLSLKEITLSYKRHDQKIEDIWEKTYEPIVDKRLAKLRKKGWNLPENNEEYFVGRNQTLNNIHEALKGSEAVALTQMQKHALTGMGGVGKTEVVKRYLFRHYHEYSIKIWLQAENNLHEQFYQLADALQVPVRLNQSDGGLVETLKSIWGAENKRPLADIVKDVYKKLRSDKGTCLIVFDNADDWQMLMQFFPPKTAKHLSSFIKILVTSRERNNFPLNEIPVDLFTPEEAREFIQNNITATDTEADDLAERLGRLPLALSHAVSYLKQKKAAVSISRYLKKFDEKRTELLQHKAVDSVSQENRASVLTTWNISLDKIKKKSIAAGKIIEHCAYLDASNIPFHIFKKLCSELNEDVRETLSLLHNYSLITISNESKSFDIHRLLQEVIQIQQHGKQSVLSWINQFVKPENDAEKILICQVLSQFSNTFNYHQDNHDKLQKLSSSISHAERLWHHVKKHKIKNKDVVHLLLTLGRYLSCERRELENSVKYLEEAHELVEYATHYEGEITSALGFIYFLKGEYRKSKLYCEQSQKCYTEDDVGITDSLCTLGHLAYRQDDLDNAYVYYDRLISILNRLDPKVERYQLKRATALHNLGNLYSSSRWTDFSSLKAILYYKDSLRLFDPKTVSISKLITLSCLAGALLDVSAIDEATHYLLEAETLAKDLFGNHDHIEKANLLLRQSTLYAEKKDFELAKETCLLAKQMYERLDDKDGKIMALIRLSHLPGEPERIRSYLNDAMEISRARENAASVANVQGILFSHDIRQARIAPQAGKEFLSTELAVDIASDDWFNRASRYYQFAIAWAERKEYALAIEYNLRAYSIFTEKSANYNQKIRVLTSLIAAFEKIGDNENIEKYCAIAIALLEGNEKENIKLYFSLIAKRAEVLSRMDRNAEAIKYYSLASTLTIMPHIIERHPNELYDVLTHLVKNKNHELCIPLAQNYLQMLKPAFSTDPANETKHYMSVAEYAMQHNDYEVAIANFEHILQLFESLPLLSGLEAAQANLTMLGNVMELHLKFDENYTCILGVDDKYSLHLTYNTDRLYCYAPLLEKLPVNKDDRMRLYEVILQASLLGGKTKGCGIGLAVKEELILIHCVIDMKRVNSLELFMTASEFVEIIEEWRGICHEFLITDETSKMAVQAKESNNLKLKQSSYRTSAILENLNRCYASKTNNQMQCPAQLLYNRQIQAIYQLAQVNLRLLGIDHRLELSFDEQATCMLGINDDFSLHITVSAERQQLFICSPLLDPLPSNLEARFTILEQLLVASMLGGKMAGGGVGVDFATNLVLMHATIDLRQANQNSLKSFSPIFLNCVEANRALCETITRNYPSQGDNHFSLYGQPTIPAEGGQGTPSADENPCVFESHSNI